VNRARADKWCCRIVELAAHALPPQQRQRYALEFIAELYGMPRAQQFQHALSVLVNTWQLRVALTDAGTSLGDQMTATTASRRPLRCRLGIHDWVLERNPENGQTYLCCVRCGRDRTDDYNRPGWQ